MTRLPIELRRALVAIAALVDLMLAALVVLGMATGTHQQFDKGVAPLAAVVSVQVLGAACLGLLAIGLRLCVAAWRDERTHHVRWWSLAIAVCWLVWAFVRVGEYAS